VQSPCAVQSFYNRFKSGQQSPFDRFAITVQSLHNRNAIAK
jgi:hypothetical protein